MAGFGGFDEDKHPRDDSGKFSSGGGGGGGDDEKEHEDSTSALSDRAFLERHGERLEEAASSSESRYDRGTGKFVSLQPGTDEHHAARVKAMHAEASKIVGEQKARKADLVPAVPEPVARARVARDEANKTVDAIGSELSTADRDALSSVRELDSLRSEELGIGDDLISSDDLASTLSESSDSIGGERYDEDEVNIESPHTALDEIAIDRDDNGDPVKWDDTDRPERHQFDDGEAGDSDFASEIKDHDERKAEHEKNAAEYNKHKADLQAKFDAKASEAQDKLEALHEKQVSALGKLKDESKKLSKLEGDDEYNIDDDEAVSERFKEKFPDAKYDEEEGVWYGANAEYDDDEAAWYDPNAQGEDDSVSPDPKLNALYEGAQAAYQRDIEDAQRAIDDDGFRGDDDAQQALKEAIKETAAAIKELARHNKRPAKLAKPPAKKTKKSANRAEVLVTDDGSELVCCVAFLTI